MASIPPNPAYIPPPQPAKQSVLSRLSPARLTQNFGLFVGRDLFGSVFSSRNALLTLPLAPLLPTLAATGMLLYQRGEEASKGNDPNPKTAQMLTSLLIAFVLATQFKGAYSILALLKTAYDMGTQTDAMSKYKSIVQNLGVFIAAYLGFKFGELFTEGLNQKDDANLRNALDPKTSPHNANWIAHNYNQPGARGELARELHVLHERLKQLSGIVGDPEVSKEFRKANVLTSQERAWTHLQSDPQLLHEFQQSDQKTLKHLSGFLERSTDNLVKAARTVNPLAYGLLFTTFLAVPVIRGVNRWIERNHPEFHGKKVEFFRFPELANTPGNYHGPGNLNAQQRAQNKNPHANLIKDHSFGDGDMEMVPVTVPDLNVVI